MINKYTGFTTAFDYLICFKLVVAACTYVYKEILLFHPAARIILLATIILVTSTWSMYCIHLTQEPLLKFHTLILPSFAPVISLRPDRSNVMAVIAALPWACVNCIDFSPVSKSHTVITEPWQPLTTYVSLRVHTNNW